MRASSSMLEPMLSPPPDEFSSTRRTPDGASATIAATFSHSRLRPAS
jgi:hypothetical protein